MKTLYISDLDGTLLTSDKILSNKTKALLNEAIRKGADFTVATARTPATVVPLLCEVEMKLPIVVMNGSFIYDIQKAKYLYTSELPYESVAYIVEQVEKAGKQLFMYTIKDDLLTVYYKGFNNPDEQAFYEERKNLALKRFVQVDTYPICAANKIGQLVMIDRYEVIKAIHDQIQDIPGIQVLMYRDVNTEDGYLLEIAAAGNNKAKGIAYLKELIAIDEVVAFGDNLNDIEMIEAAECGCAVGNAEPALKAVADYVIDNNNEDGVAKFIDKQLSRMSA